jgi:hypothetical protein
VVQWDSQIVKEASRFEERVEDSSVEGRKREWRKWVGVKVVGWGWGYGEVMGDMGVI